jgi:Type IV secretion-system coupling protein DNA-binding domain
MAEVSWGRKETIVWPPHKPIYTLGALFLGLIATGFFVYFRFIFGLSPLQQFYLPAYIKTAAIVSVPIHTKYRMLLMSDAKRHAWYARDVDVEPGSTPQPTGKPIPVQLSDSARRSGMVFLYHSLPIVLSGIGVQQYLRQQVYDGQSLLGMFGLQIVLGGIFFLLQLPWSIPKDIRRWKEMKYGRRLKGPILVTPKQFNKAIKGGGIGIKVDRSRDLLRVPERAEDQHFEIIGDTGSGKTTIIMQMLRQIQARKHSAII